MNPPKTTQFWLQIRPAYVIENFENLVSYLRSYSYDINRRENNVDYDATVDVMLDMAEEYGEKIIESPFELPEFDIKDDLLIRLLAATILAAKRRGENAGKIVFALVALLAHRYTKFTESELLKLATIGRDASLGMTLVSAGFSFDLIDSKNYSLDLLVHRMLAMTFTESGMQIPRRYVEHHGVAMMDKEEPLILYAGNLQAFNNDARETFMEIPSFMKLQLPKEDMKRSNGFKSLYDISNGIIRSLDSIKPSPKRPLRDYQPADEFIVEVVEKRNALVVARTISPDYNGIRGKVNLMPQISISRPSRTVAQEQLRVGDFLRVRLDPSEEFAFKIAETFESFYRRKALEYSRAYTVAVYERQYPEGYTFVTRDGVRMSIYGKTVEKYNQAQIDALDRAIDEGNPVKVMFWEARCTAEDPKFILYGAIERDGYVCYNEDDKFDVSTADRNLFNAFLDECYDEASRIIEKIPDASEPIDPVLLRPCLTLIARLMADGFDDSATRLEYATIGVVLSKIIDYREGVSYFENERKFVSSLVDFAQGKPIAPVEVAEDMKAQPHVERQQQLLSVLRGYVGDSVTEGKQDTDLVERVKKLVEASNSLRNIMDDRELVSIKRIIARTLGVEDEFVGNQDERTFYGVENDVLEFKSSIVFPPANRRRVQSAIADPMLQKWAIIRTVCGFLNSHSGGDLLLGVRDTGYALGISNDITALRSLGLIAFASADSYRTYVQGILDQSFVIEGQPATQPSSITRSSVTYEIETSQEGLEILRVKIQPYKSGVVQVKPVSGRPAFVDDAYIRLSGRTVVVTPELRPNLLKNKRL